MKKYPKTIHKADKKMSGSKNTSQKIWLIAAGISVILTLVVLAGCAPAAQPTTNSEAPEATEEIIITEEIAATEGAEDEETPSEEVAAEEPTPAPTSTAEKTEAVSPTDEPIDPSLEIIESLPDERVIELEWPEEMWLREADVIILSLIPASEGYILEAEFADHAAQSEPIEIPQPEGYTLLARARLDAPGFSLASEAEQEFQLHPSEPVIWRWALVPENSGRQRINIHALIIFEPPAGIEASVIEHTLLSESLEIQVNAIFGLPRGTARVLLVLILVILFTLGVLLLVYFLLLRPKSPIRQLSPDPDVKIEAMSNRPLDSGTYTLMQSLFQGYARIIITNEFQSGYSGARTWLVMPIRRDGRHDAQTIVKVGAEPVILSEYRNYEAFVKDTLPPMTARIQDKPVSIKGQRLAALRYTFIGLSGQTPLSLREALLRNPDPAYLERLFETFGPHWWCQRSPATFRLASAYDGILPSHLVMAPANGKGQVIDGHEPETIRHISVNDLVTLRNFPVVERRADGRSFTLENQPQPGSPPLRVRWMASRVASPVTGKVTATRWSILRTSVEGKPLFELDDPLEALDELLQTTVHGSTAIIHGDLNLENILVGPGDMVWLIDFARTRKAPPLIDFTHLYGEIIAQVIAPKEADPAQFLMKLKRDEYPLLAAIDGISTKLLPNDHQREAYDLPLIITCLGMLKFPNLSDHARHLLYLAAAWKYSRSISQR
jgi:hypothetical protein